MSTLFESLIWWYYHKKTIPSIVNDSADLRQSYNAILPWQWPGYVIMVGAEFLDHIKRQSSAITILAQLRTAVQWPKPRIRHWHYLPPGSLHALGHPGLFHAATYLLNWYKMACMANIYIWVKFMNMLLCVCNLGHRGIFFEEILRS